MTDTSDTRWSRNLFNSLRDGGTWGVPRSGLVFQRRGKTLHLIARMPFDEELAAAARAGHDVPADAAALRRYQDQDFAAIRDRFAVAGIGVFEATP